MKDFIIHDYIVSLHKRKDNEFVTVINKKTNELYHQSIVKGNDNLLSDWNIACSVAKYMAISDITKETLEKMIKNNNVILKQEDTNNFIYYSKNGFYWNDGSFISSSVSGVISYLAKDIGFLFPLTEDVLKRSKTTYEEKAVDFLQEKLGIEKQYYAKDIINYVKKGYTPHLFGALNAPVSAEWDDLVIEDINNNIEYEER